MSSNAGNVIMFRGINVEAGDVIELPVGESMGRFAIMPSDSSAGNFAYAIDEYGEFVPLSTGKPGTARVVSHESVLVGMLSEYDILLDKMLSVHGNKQQILEICEKRGMNPLYSNELLAEEEKTRSRLEALGRAVAEVISGAVG